MNPFTFGNPVKDPANFYGRKEEVRQIVNRLLSSAHESTSIIGERRIGKTSLLNYLSHPEVGAKLGLTPNKFCLVYVDFQGLTDITPTRFWQRVLKKMSASVCDEGLKPSIEEFSKRPEFDLFDLEDLFQTSLDKGLTIILLLDEFEYVTENPNFRGDFFGGLRALAIHSGVALVPSTRRELVDLCHSDEIKGSPFFNIFANVVLRPFSRAEVDALLEGTMRGSDFALTSEDRKFVWALGGGHPLFAQVAGHYLYEARAQGLSAPARREYVTASFEQQADSHYNYLWSHCTESEKITLLVVLTVCSQERSKTTVANAENLGHLRPRAPQDAAILARRGLLENTLGVYRIFSPTFERWMRREIMAAPGEEESEESAEKWLVSGGQKDVKQARAAFPRFKKTYWPLISSYLKELSIKTATEVTVTLAKALVA